MRDAFETNCIAPLFLSKAFLPLIQKAAEKDATTGKSVSKAAIIQVYRTDPKYVFSFYFLDVYRCCKY